jgi:integral membrane protein
VSLSWIRIIAIAEAISYLALLVAVVAKRVFAEPGGVTVIGPIHGVIFLAYVAAVIFAREDRHWDLPTTLACIVASVIPFGGYVVERRLLRDRVAA